MPYDEKPKVMEQPQVQPDVENDLMAVVGNLQEAIAQINSRCDELENKVYQAEDDVSQVEAMDEEEKPDMVVKKEPKIEEQANVGGEDKSGDLEDIDEKGKLKGGASSPANPMQEMKKKMEEMLKKMEELTGVPEVPRGKKEMPIGHKPTVNTPASQQPPSGDSPSGEKTFDDGNAEDEAKKAEAEVEKPSKDWNKPAVSKNMVEDEEDKKKEEGVEDPSKPAPGETKEKPDTMNVAAEKIFRELHNEVNGSLYGRKSYAGSVGVRSNEKTKTKSDFWENRKKASDIISEYLSKGVRGFS